MDHKYASRKRMDSAVKLYESRAVSDAGAKAMTQGADIAFAPGMLDFTSFGGQSLLGHEISHVDSQARGEVTGGGFLNDHALEARADREGAMAAAGEQVYMPTASPSPVTAAAAAGPRQAGKNEKAESDAVNMSVNFNNHVFNPSYQYFGGHRKGKDRFEDIARNTSWRGVRAMNRIVRNEQKKYERQRQGNYTQQKLLNGENDLGLWRTTKDLQREKNQSLLSLLNMQCALKAVRSGKSYTVSHDLSDFAYRKGNSYAATHDPNDFIRR